MSSQSVIHKPTTQHHLNFLLAPPPPPRSKSPRPAASQGTQLQRPHLTRNTSATAIVPRSPLSPRESFLNILDTPSPPGTLDHKRSSPTQQQLLDASSILLKELGYNITINTFYVSQKSPVTPRPTASKPQPRNPTKSISSKAMNILTRDRATSSAKHTPSSSSSKMPLHSRSNHAGGSPPTTGPRPQHVETVRRGSVPTLPSSSQNPSPHHSKQSSSSSSSAAQGSNPQGNRKRYPLPLPYAAVVEMDQILGDMRSAQNVSNYIAASSLATSSNAYTRGATVLPPSAKAQTSGVQLVGSGAPYIGADGRLWRDREEEMEYKGLLASPKSAASQQHTMTAMQIQESIRRGSAETDETIQDDEDRFGRRAWAKFGHHHSKSTHHQATSGAPKTVYDGFKASEQRLRLPSSSATSSSEDDDEEGDALDPWSPLVETHTAQHQFPAYVFPGSGAHGSKSSRRSGNTTVSSPLSINGFAASASKSKTSATKERVLPLPVSMKDFTVKNSGVAIHVHPPQAKDEFLASSFVPVPSSRSGSRPPVSGPSSSTREGRRASVQGYLPSSTSSASAPRRRDEVPSKPIALTTEIELPLPSIAPTHANYLAAPTPLFGSSKAKSSSRPSTASSEKEKRGGFLGVFKKSSK